jgi:hypothetical protein
MAERRRASSAAKPPKVTDDRAASLQAYDHEISQAWKEEHVEFGNALDLAVTIRITIPLAEYVEQHPLTDNERRQLGGWIRSLSRHRAGRPREKQLEREVAYLVMIWQQQWREGERRKHIPADRTDVLFQRAAEQVAKAHGVDKDIINMETARDFWRTGRVKRLRH